MFHSGFRDLTEQKYFTAFIPSWRSIEFFQKNIRQLNVEFIETNVLIHKLNGTTFLSYNDIFCAENRHDITMPGQEQTKKHITARKHVDTFFKSKICFLFSLSAVVNAILGRMLFLCFSFATTNIL
jgi:uncharacterized membrane protein